MSIQAVITRIKQQSEPMGSGATRAQIAAAEQELGVTLPASYKTFLETFGWGDVGYKQIYGLGDGVPEYQNVVKSTYDERHEVEPPMRHDLVPLANDGFGNHNCLDTSKLVDGECPVVFWNHELGSDQEPELVVATFAAWLEEALDKYESEQP